MRDSSKGYAHLATLISVLLAQWQQLRQNKFIVNASAYMSGAFIQQGLNFLLLPLWAYFLTPTDYGITGTLVAYTQVIQILLVMGLHAAILRHYYDHTNDIPALKSYIFSVFVFQSIASTIFMMAAFMWGPAIWMRYTNGLIPFTPYVPLTLGSLYLTVLISPITALYRAQERAGRFVTVQYIQLGLRISMGLIFVVGLQWGAYGVLLGQLCSILPVALLVLLDHMRTWFTWQIRWYHMWAALIYGLPFVPHLLTRWALDLSDRIILEQFVSLSELGLYNFGYTLGAALGLLATSLNQAWIPYYFRLMKEVAQPAPVIIKVVSYYVAGFGGLCLAGILFAGEVIYLFLPDRYFGSLRYFSPVVLASLMTGFYYFGSMPLFFYKKTLIIPIFTVIGGAINIGLNLWLIPYYGAIAAAWTTLAANTFIFVIFFAYGRRLQRLDYPLSRYALLVAFIFVTALVLPVEAGFEVLSIAGKLCWLMGYGLLAYGLLIRR